MTDDPFFQEIEDHIDAEPTDLERIIAIPRFEALGEGDVLSMEYTERFVKPGSDWTIRPEQAAALEEALHGDGGFYNIGVGYGKTLIGLLLPKVLGVSPYKTAIIVPARNVDSLVREAKKYLPHIDYERRVKIATYHDLSNNPYLLEKWEPELIVCDEAHKLKNLKTASRTIRFMRYVRESGARFVGMSGTLLDSSIDEFTHLLEAAFENAPVPRTEERRWRAVLDTDSDRSMPNWQSWKYMEPLAQHFGPVQETALYDVQPATYRKEVIREAYRERLQTTPGIVMTSKSAIGIPLIINPLLDVQIPTIVKDAIEKASTVMMLPNGDFIEDELRLAAALRQLICGYYYIWDWPGDPDWDWLDARRGYYRELRKEWQRGRRGLDSEGLVRSLVEQTDAILDRVRRLAAFEDELDEDWRAVYNLMIQKYQENMTKVSTDLWNAWLDWKVERHKPEPPRLAVWISDYLVDDIIARCEEYDRPTLVWTDSVAFTERLDQRGMLVVPRGGEPPIDAPQTCVVSVKSHGTGHNLQMGWSHNLVVNMQSSGATMEQLIGRTHRPGQPEPEVTLDVYAHHALLRKIIWKAIEKAQLAEGVTGQQQKILRAEWTKEVF